MAFRRPLVWVDGFKAMPAGDRVPADALPLSIDLMDEVIRNEDMNGPPWTMVGFGDPGLIGVGTPFPVDLVANPTDDTCSLSLGLALSGQRMELMTIWPTYPVGDANKVYATNTTGLAGRPRFRALEAEDIPNLNANKIIDGTLAPARLPAPYNSGLIPGNRVLAGPAIAFEGDNTPTFRELVPADIPALPASQINSGAVPYLHTTFPPDFIHGLELRRTGVSTIAISAGTAYIQSLGYPVEYPGGSVTVGTAANTWYHLYLTSIGGIFAVTTPPSSPYHGTARSRPFAATQRYIGSVLNDASGNLRFFKHDWQAGQVLWRENITAAPFRVLASGTATTRTIVACATVAPVTATEVKALGLTINSNTAFCTFDTSDRALATSQGFSFINTAGAPAMQTMLDLMLNASQQFRYAWSDAPAGAGCFIDVMGYRYER